MCLEVKNDYQKSSWLKSLSWAIYVLGPIADFFMQAFQNPSKKFRAAQRRQKLFGPSGRSGGILPQESLKMEPLRLAKNAFPANS